MRASLALLLLTPLLLGWTEEDTAGLAAGLVVAAPTVLVLHEASHLAVASLQTDLDHVEFRPYPHTREGQFYLGAVYWRESPPLTGGALAFTLLAPRIVDLLLLGLIAALDAPPPGWRAAVLAVVACAIFDLAFGSIGASDASDLQRASAAVGMSPWVLRTAGFALAAGAATAATAMVLQWE